MKKFTFVCLAILSTISIGCQHKVSENPNDALAELNKEYEMQKKQNGEDSSLLNFVDKYQILSKQFEDSGNLHKVIECEKMIVEIYTQTLKEPQSKIAFRKMLIGDNYAKLQENDSAETYLLQSIETSIKVKESETDHDSIDIDVHGRLISLCYRILSSVSSNKGEIEKAVEYLEDAIQYQPIEMVDDKHTYAVYLASLASLYEEQSRYAEAEKFYENSLKIFEKVFPDSILWINDLRESLSEIRNLAH